MPATPLDRGAAHDVERAGHHELHVERDGHRVPGVRREHDDPDADDQPDVGNAERKRGRPQRRRYPGSTARTARRAAYSFNVACNGSTHTYKLTAKGDDRARPPPSTISVHARDLASADRDRAGRAGVRSRPRPRRRAFRARSSASTRSSAASGATASRSPPDVCASASSSCSFGGEPVPVDRLAHERVVALRAARDHAGVEESSRTPSITGTARRRRRRATPDAASISRR